MKDYRTWWRRGKHVAAYLEEEMFTHSYGKTNGHLIDTGEIELDIDDWQYEELPDEVFEQIWAIREGLA